MAVAPTLTIDASALNRVDFTTYLTNYFRQLSDGASTFYGGTPDSAFGGTYYMNGSEVVSRFKLPAGGDQPGADSAKTVIIDGADLAYDFIHHGAAFGHGITGSVETLLFGNWVAATSGTQGTGAEGRIQGLQTGLVIDGFGITTAAGAGTDPATNLTYAVYSAVKAGDAAALYDLIKTYAISFTGTKGNDVVDGYALDDRLVGGAGHDLLLNSLGNDTLLGGTGADTLRGGNGDDVLNGGVGADVLRAGTGADRLTGGAGDDVMAGGAGADVFVFAAGSGRDTIVDFEPSVDRIDVSALNIDSLADFRITERASHVELRFEGTVIRLPGVDAEDLTNSAFLF